MNSLMVNAIDDWVIEREVKRDSMFSIFLVHYKTELEKRFYLVMEQDLSSDISDLDPDSEFSALPVNLSCRPHFNYTNNHCFPLIPSKCASGFYNGNEYFLIEKFSRSLSAVVSDQSFLVSKDDLLNIASQILNTLYILFSKQLVVKNLHINDFFLRRTSNGFRVVYLNQDFYNNSSYIISDSTFTSLSVMNGNVPTQRDNLMSLAYILAYISYKTLPWIGKSDHEGRILKQDCSTLFAECPVYSDLLTMLTNSDPSLNAVDIVKDAIAFIKNEVTTSRITFGLVVLKSNKTITEPQQSDEAIKADEKPSQPFQSSETTDQTPRILTVAGQKYEMKKINGKQLIVPVKPAAVQRRIRRPTKIVSTEEVENVASEQSELPQQAIVVNKKPQQRRDRDRVESVEKGEESQSKRRRVDRIQSRSM